MNLREQFWELFTRAETRESVTESVWTNEEGVAQEGEGAVKEYEWETAMSIPGVMKKVPCRFSLLLPPAPPSPKPPRYDLEMTIAYDGSSTTDFSLFHILGHDPNILTTTSSTTAPSSILIPNSRLYSSSLELTSSLDRELPQPRTTSGMYVSNLTRPTTEGLVMGTLTNDESCYLWAGIPFGTIPSGPGRYKVAQPPPNHSDTVLDCTKFGDAPVSVSLSFTHFHEQAESFDCLTLNIYVPILSGEEDRQSLTTNSFTESIYFSGNATATAAGPSGGSQPATSMPVLFWIHGGAFASGAGAAYGGEYLASEGHIIVVTINYRLGVFGFLNLKSAFDSSDDFDFNVGLSDQVAALQWIHRNIQNFNGDPNRITIAGSAAGSACVAMHLTHELSQPYFQRAIMHSGSLSMCDDFEASRDKALRFLSLMRKKTGKTTLSELKEFLFTGEAEMIQDLLAEPIEQSREHFPIGPFFGTPELPLSRHAALNSLPLDKSVLVGYNRDEANLWLVLANAGGLPLTKAAVDHVLHRIPDEQRRREITALYPRDMTGITNFATDVIFANTTRLVADYLAARRFDPCCASGVWRYRLDEPLAILPQLGAAHGQELSRIWRMPGASAMLGAGAADPAAEPLSWRLRAAWWQFVRFGTPGWERYMGNQANIMVFESAAFQHPDYAADSADRLIVDHESAKKARVWRGLELTVW